jgi:hypothetical protein
MPQANTQKTRDLEATHDMPVQTRAASIAPASFNATDNTVDVVWTTGSRVRRYDYWNDTVFEEELVVTPEAVDMTRFDAGAVQVLDGHQVYGGVDAILGIATAASVANGEGRASLRLSTREEKSGIVADIAAGIIRNISFGYSVERYEITRAQDRTDGINLPLYLAVRWTPQEISFVTVPADPNAGTRSQPGQGADAPALQRHAAANGRPCQFVTRAAAPNPQQQETTMPQANAATQGGAQSGSAEDQTRAQPDAGAAAAAATQAAAAAAQAGSDATIRAAAITELCTRHNVGHLAAGFIRNAATTLEQAQAAVLNELAVRDAASGGHHNTQIRTVTDEHETRMRGIEEALTNRVDSKAALTDNGRQYRGMSMLEIGRDFLSRSGQDVRGLDRMSLATRMLTFRSAGMLGTSDFTNLLANIANKRLRQAYQENNPSYAMWARRATNAPDFKAMSVVQLGGAPDLLKVNEHGEVKYGSMSDGAETYSVLTYARKVAFTRQSIVNDDMRGFDRLVGAFGGASRRLENRIVYAQLTANAAMADTGNLFNATAVATAGGHANLLSGAGSALQFSSLVTGRTQMRVQKGFQSEELNIAPAYLLVPAALEQTAYQLTSNVYTPAVQTNINEFRQGGRTALTPVVEPILDANSATAWYLAADSSQVDTVEYCYLDGAEGPVIESEVNLDVDGVAYRCRLDFAAKAIDFRGLIKSAGA